MPKGFLANRKLTSLRAALLARFTVDGVIELPMNTFIKAGTTVRTSVLLLTKSPPKRRSRTILTKVGDPAELPRVSAAFR
jgi:type I restriction-modification system DNA methylase subunit